MLLTLIKMGAARLKVAPSNKRHTSTCGAFWDLDHNLTITKLKYIWSKYDKYANNETLKISSSFGCGAYQRKYGKYFCNIDDGLIE